MQIKHLTAILLLLFLSLPAWAAYTYSQKASNSAFGSNSCAMTVSATGSGNAAFVLVWTQSTPANTPITGVASTNNTFTKVSDGTSQASFALGMTVWYVGNMISGDTTVTASATGTPVISCYYYEFSGAPTSVVEDTATVIQNAPSGNPMNGSPITPTNSGDVCLAIMGTQDSSNGPFTSSNWTQFQTNTAQDYNAAAYLLPGAVTSQTPTFSGDTTGANNNNAGSTVCFLPAAGGGATSIPSITINGGLEVNGGLTGN